MGTFNAGAIEAKLTLDRSAFTRELREAKAQAAAFERDKIKPEVVLKGKDKLDALAVQLKRLDGQSIDIRLDTSGDAIKDIRTLEAQVKRLSSKEADINVDIKGIDDLVALEAMIKEMSPQTIRMDLDFEGALNDLAAFEALVRQMNGQNINLEIDVDGYHELVELAVMVEALDGRDIDLNVDANGGARTAIMQTAQHFSRFQAILAAVLVLLPLVPPVAATATGALLGLSAGLVGAGGALGAVGIAVAPTVMNMMALNEEIQKNQTRLQGMKEGSKEYVKQAAKIKELQASMASQYGDASKGMSEMGKAWRGFQDQVRPEANKIVGDLFRTIATLIPPLTPIFKAAAPVILDMLKGIQNFAKGPEMDRVVKFFADFGSKSLGQVLRITGNLIQFFGRLFEAFAPFGTTFLGAIEDVTAAWSAWADNLGQTQGFQDFIAYISKDGPKVWDLIENITLAFINFGIALAPLGAVSLDVFNAIFGFLANVDPTLLGAFSIAIGTAVTGMLALVAATALWNAILAANPVGIIIIAITALVGAIIYLWNTNDTFRGAIITAWEAIKTAFTAVVDWFTGTAVPMFQAAWSSITGFFAAAWGQIGPIVTGINDIIILMVQIVMQSFQNMWVVVGPILQVLWSAISFTFRNVQAVVVGVAKVVWAVLSAAFANIRAVVSATMSVVGAIWVAVWNNIRAVFIAVINVVKAVLRTVLAAMRGDVSGTLNGIKGIWSAVWNGIRSVTSTAIAGIRSVLSAGINGAKAVITTALNGIVSVFRSTLNAALGVVRSVIGNIKGAFSGAGGWLIGAGRSIIQGLIDGIRGMAGPVVSAVKGVLQSARNLLPFSPAKEGPFSGKGWTLYSGQSIVKALAQGINDEAYRVRDATLALVNAANPEMDLSFAGAGRMGGYGLAPVGGGGSYKYIDVKVEAHNPVAEKSSETAVKEVTGLAQLGAFDG